jgi:hypothetical protein
MTEKIDLRKQYKSLYSPSAKNVATVDVPGFKFVMFDGAIQPGVAPANSPEFQDAIGALYGVAFTLKFMSKLRKENPLDFTVMALEGLWWVEGEQFDFQKKQPWRFTLMIMQPEHITPTMYAAALDQLNKKKPSTALTRLRLADFHEGLCMQIMHIGPYSEEPATIAKMHDFAQQNGYRLHGKHHEIYMGDPRRAKPERLKTILRQPLEKI